MTYIQSDGGSDVKARLCYTSIQSFWIPRIGYDDPWLGDRHFIWNVAQARHRNNFFFSYVGIVRNSGDRNSALIVQSDDSTSFQYSGANDRSLCIIYSTGTSSRSVGGNLLGSKSYEVLEEADPPEEHKLEELEDDIRKREEGIIVKERRRERGRQTGNTAACTHINYISF